MRHHESNTQIDFYQQDAAAHSRDQVSAVTIQWLSETGEYIAVYLSSLLSVSPQMKDSSFQTKLEGHFSQYTQDCLVKYVHAVLNLSSWCKLAAAFVSVGKANWKHRKGNLDLTLWNYRNILLNTASVMCVD